MVCAQFTKSRFATECPTAARSGQALAPGLQPWHGGDMTQQNGQASRAGGAIIALSVLAGAFIGARQGQPSLGTVIGTGVGVAIAIALYLYDRSRG